MEGHMDVAEAPIPSAPVVAMPVAPEVPPLLLVAAKLFTAEGKMLVTLLEMSSDYAVAATTAPPAAGSIAVLARCGARASVTVAWVDGQRVGLLFDRPLSDGLLDQLAG